MKKITSALFAVCLIISLITAMAISSTAAQVSYNLIPSDGDWVTTPVTYGTPEVTHDVTFSFEDGVMSLSTGGFWPNIQCIYAAPLEVPEDAVLEIDFTLVKGKMSIRLFSDEQQVWLHQYIPGIDDKLENGTGDVMEAGHYTASIPMSNLMNSTNHDDGSTKVALNFDNNKILFDKIQIFVIDECELSINKLQFTTGEDEVSDMESSDIVSEQSSEITNISSEETNSVVPGTGDFSIIPFAIVFIAGATGIYLIRKKR